MSKSNRKIRKRRRRANKHANNRYENLEQRQLLASITADPVGRTITVEGSNLVDVLQITDVNSYTQINIDLVVDGTPFEPGQHVYNRSDFDEVIVYAHDGDDVLENGSVIESRMYGGLGNDTITGGWQTDRLIGGNGNDSIFGRNGIDYIWGGDGDDTLQGGQNDDYLNGGDGNDQFYFAPSVSFQNDFIYEQPGEGEDELLFSYLPANDPVDVNLSSSYTVATHTNRSVNTLQAGNFENVTGSQGDDSIKGNQVDNKLKGFNGNDLIWGFNGNDVLWGGNGNDNLNGGGGNDNLNGGNDNDSFYFATATSAETDWIFEYSNGGDDQVTFSALGANDGVDVDLSITINGLIATHTNRSVGAVEASALERVVGGAGDDTVVGNSLNNVFSGGDGNDRFEGLGGSDYMRGDAGNDVYIFGNASSFEWDTVVEGYNGGIDSLDFRNVTAAVTADFENVTDDIVASHTNREVRSVAPVPQIGVHLENAFGIEGQDIWSFDGTGQTSAIIDSGIAYDHAALGDGFGAGFKVVAGNDYLGSDTDPYDEGPFGSHGTHVAGIVASEDQTHTGVAPGSDLVALRVLDSNGGTFENVRDALQWVIDNAATHNITTVNMSLGNGQNYQSVPTGFPVIDQIEDRLETLDQMGIFVSVSAGNDFEDTNNTPGLAYPAISSFVTPVASHGNGANEFTMSDFSQRFNNVLTAPGEDITSTVPDWYSGSTDEFDSFSGTSMAAPYVAGASMLLREAYDLVGINNVDREFLHQVFSDFSDDIFDPATNDTYEKINLEEALAAAVIDQHMPVMGSSAPPSSGGGGLGGGGGSFGGSSVDTDAGNVDATPERFIASTPEASEWFISTDVTQKERNTKPDTINELAMTQFDRAELDQGMERWFEASTNDGSSPLDIDRIFDDASELDLLPTLA